MGSLEQGYLSLVTPNTSLSSSSSLEQSSAHTYTSLVAARQTPHGEQTPAGHQPSPTPLGQRPTSAAPRLTGNRECRGEGPGIIFRSVLALVGPSLVQKAPSLLPTEVGDNSHSYPGTQSTLDRLRGN